MPEKMQPEMLILLSVPLGKLPSTMTVPQPDQVRSVMPKLLVVTFRAVKSGVRQVTIAPFTDTSCSGPRTGGRADDSMRVGGNTRVVVLGPVAAWMC